MFSVVAYFYITYICRCVVLVNRREKDSTTSKEIKGFFNVLVFFLVVKAGTDLLKEIVRFAVEK